MIGLESWRNTTVAVMGLGRSGLAAARALKASGADVWAWDDDPGRRNALKRHALTPVDLGRVAWHRVSALILSPGIPDSFPVPHPVAARARRAGTPILTDVELLLRAQSAAGFIAVTGTNGKSTTTALIGHVLAQAGWHVETGGNLGRPALDLAPLGQGSWYVLELSSYQIERLQSRVIDVGVLVNISPDHIDRHGTFGGYIHAKEGLFRLQRPGGTAIVATDDMGSRQIARRLLARGTPRCIQVATTTALEDGVRVDADGRLLEVAGGQAEPVASLGDHSALPGGHNWQNAACAYAAATAAGLDRATAAAGLADFPGLPHRLEPLGQVGGVAFVNDSKATNPEAAARALAAYSNIYWIAGGRAKTGTFDGLREHLGGVAHAFLYGEAAGVLAETLRARVPVSPHGSLEAATRAAFEAARANAGETPVVLLSPACTAFDQHADFAERGEAFRHYVVALAHEIDGHSDGIRDEPSAGAPWR